MDKISKVKAEIERLISELGEQRDINLEDLLDFINSLPEEPVSEDAIDAVIHPDDGEIWTDKKDLEKYDEDQKVKVIIMKKE